MQYICYLYSTYKERMRENERIFFSICMYIHKWLNWMEETRENTEVFTGTDLANNIL